MNAHTGHGVYWRVEWHDGDILAAPALSTGWAGVDGNPPTTLRGLSCFASAEELVDYFEAWISAAEKLGRYELDEDHPYFEALCRDQAEVAARSHRIPTDTSRVVCFRGEQVGVGLDGDVLALPVEVIYETTYGQLRACEALGLFDGVDDAETIARLMSAEPARPAKEADDVVEYEIGGLCVLMSDASAEAWNECDWNDDLELRSYVYDVGKDVWWRLGDALLMPWFAGLLEGRTATKADISI